MRASYINLTSRLSLSVEQVRLISAEFLALENELSWFQRMRRRCWVGTELSEVERRARRLDARLTERIEQHLTARQQGVYRRLMGRMDA